MLDLIGRNSVKLSVDPEAIQDTYNMQVAEALKKHKKATMYGVQVATFRLDQKVEK